MNRLHSFIAALLLLLVFSHVSRADAGHFSPIALGTYYYESGLCAPGDEGAVRSFRARAGRLPAVWMIFQGWTGWNQFPVQQARRAKQLGAKICVTWEPWRGHANDGSWSCAQVAGGRYDAYIRSYARAVKSAEVPVMIRFAHEMNGNWYPWGTAYDGYFRRFNGNSPSDFVSMWKRVVTIFRQEGAFNAQWVWAPNILYMNRFNTAQTQNSDLRALYPGDGFVDWIGLSVYNDGAARQWRSFPWLVDSAYQIVTSITAKPLMIAEIGVTEQGAPSGQSKAQWIEETFLRQIPTRYRRVRMVCYFSRDKSNMGESNYRFDSSEASLRAFRQVANSPLYSARF